MPKHWLTLFFLTNISLLLLSGCVSRQPVEQSQYPPTAQQRIEQLQQLSQWQIRGKIAFIQQQIDQQEQRESANIVWRVDEHKQNQSLNLTSYLGINVLSLSSSNGQHVLKVDGEEYNSDNLTQLIYALTGLTLPTEALTFWLKGIAYQPSDQISYNAQNHLPSSMQSYYQNTYWHISYDNYQFFKQLPMATKLTIKKDQLTIKIAIKHWSFLSKES